MILEDGTQFMKYIIISTSTQRETNKEKERQTVRKRQGGGEFRERENLYNLNIFTVKNN